jgi:hypothetical protein
MFVGKKIKECVGQRSVIRPVKWGFSQYSANPVCSEKPLPFAGLTRPYGIAAQKAQQHQQQLRG